MTKKTLSIIFVVCLAAAFLYGCQDKAPQTPAAKQAEAVQTPAPPAAPAAQSTAKAAPVAKPAPKPPAEEWPFLSKMPADIQLSKSPYTKNYVVVLDGSGSMDETKCAEKGKTKIQVAKEAIAEWVKTIPDEDVNIALVSFHGKQPEAPKGWTIIDLKPKADAKEFFEALGYIRADKNTPLATALKTAYGMLTMQGQRQLGTGEFTVVVVTDGEDNDEHESLSKWVSAITRSPIQIYTIGFCIGSKHYLNQKGKTHYVDANNPQELQRGLQEVLSEE